VRDAGAGECSAVALSAANVEGSIADSAGEEKTVRREDEEKGKAGGDKRGEGNGREMGMKGSGCAKDGPRVSGR
jgi:hypothetical protein